MKRAKTPLGIGVALLLAAASALLASPPPSFSEFLAADPGSSPAPAVVPGQPAVASSTPATPVDTCGLRKYSCQACPSTVLPLKLCYEQICGSFVIFHCDPCAAHCSLPPDGL